MDREHFEKEIRSFHRFINECRKKAIEILMKLQGETEFRLVRNSTYTFIGHGEGRFETAFLKEGEPWFTIRLENGTTRDIDFFEAVWDTVLLCDVMDKLFDLERCAQCGRLAWVLLCDVMDKLFDLDGDTDRGEDDDCDEDFYCSVH